VSAQRLITDRELYQLAEEVGRAARAAGWRIVTAESCTAGWIAKALTDIPGSSLWVDCGYVTYSNTAKIRDLGVSARTLQERGAVSETTVREMANGARRRAGVELAIAVSGIAGPDGGTADKPVGTVWFAIAAPQAQGDAAVCELRHFAGDREQVRRQAVEHALRLALPLLRAASGH
jgi:nicotinamide-nucleotide amidase